ncbi:hypothetical protein RB595_005964 [Gaeumannomyces hyphopodioides]
MVVALCGILLARCSSLRGLSSLPRFSPSCLRMAERTDRSTVQRVCDDGVAEHSSTVPTRGREIDIDALVRGTGRVFATKFIPPSVNAVPMKVFTGRKRHIQILRFTLPNDPGVCLIHTDGASLGNGQKNPRAGWGFWHGECPTGEAIASGRLETKGPFGDEGAQTSNRAELRAVIAALRFRYWPGERFHTCVIATDSKHVVEGCTNWARSWIRRSWKTSTNQPVANKDLWEALLGEIEKKHYDGIAVQFWRISRVLNSVADAAARAGAREEHLAEGRWVDVPGRINF